MFINFRVRNYRSIRDEAVFSMEKRGQTKELPENCLQSPALPRNMSLLKSSVIYGGNASGKSNLIHAVMVMQNLVRHQGVGDLNGRKMLEPYLLSENSMDEPTLFEMEFVSKERRYRYGFECTSERIVSEWLYAQKQRMTLMFARERDHFVEASPDFHELTVWKKLVGDTKLTLPNDALFLTTVARFLAGGSCEAVYDWFEHTLVVLSAETHQQYLAKTFEAMKDLDSSRTISMLISKADFGIQSIESEISEEKDHGMASVRTMHVVDGRTYKLDMFHHESAGTQKVFALSAPLLEVLRNGKVLFIDELDSSLHPLLVSHLLDLFHTDNHKNAQIVATTHSPTLLTETAFRHDQVWFVSKNDNGVTSLASLADFTGIRGNFARIVKDYLHGCFGAVPNIRNLNVEGDA